MRIAIVNDSPTAVEVLRRILERGTHALAWVARNGTEAVELCRSDLPELILMDMVMPQMGGVEATRRIMRETPCPILVVTASVQGNLSAVFDALGAGALDAVTTPELGQEHGLVHKIGVIEQLKSPAPPRPEPLPRAVPFEPGALPPLVLLGASTGGPQALAAILGALPRNCRAAVVAIQHLGREFVPGFVDWLQQHTELPVNAVRQETLVESGRVYVAETDDHLVFGSGGVLRYSAEPRESANRPSVDACFLSAARYCPQPGIAAVLTGMGRDGARGMRALHDAGWRTLAQDRKTSVVFGMPQAAIEAGGVDTVARQAELGPLIRRLLET